MTKLNIYFSNLFEELKILNGDNIVVCSNLSTFGISGKNLPKIIIKELKKAVGSNGTILMPLYTLGINPSKIFDKSKIYKNKYISLLSKCFFKTEAVKRSNCPIHSHIGLGKKSNILLKSNYKNTYGKNSDFHLMKKNKFKLILLGCSAQEGATYFHQIEAMKNLKYGKWITFKRKIIKDKKIKVINVNFFEKKKIKHNLNNALKTISKKSKTFITVKNKYYNSSIIDINELHKLTVLELNKNEYFLIKNAR